MRINVARVINGQFTDPITVVRQTQDGAQVDGMWRGGKSASSTAMQASVQPFQMHELANLPEGVREYEWIWVYAPNFQFKGTIPFRSADIIQWRGAEWRVERVEEWSQGGYTRAMAVKKKATGR